MDKWIYWKDECDFCTEHKNCMYERKTRDFRGALGNLESNTKKVYGTLNFKCDYFSLDEEKYKQDQKLDCCCNCNDCKEEPVKSIITLCGSTKFKDDFIELQKRLSLEGHIVLTVGLFGHSGDDEVYNTPGVKEMLDRVHLRKIDMSDEIYVVNIDGYIGESTKNEIKYAVSTNKKVNFLIEDEYCNKFLSSIKN